MVPPNTYFGVYGEISSSCWILTLIVYILAAFKPFYQFLYWIFGGLALDAQFCLPAGVAINHVHMALHKLLHNLDHTVILYFGFGENVH